jgi:hypothetical protein
MHLIFAHRIFALIAAVGALAAGAVAIAGTAAGAPSSGNPNRTLDQAIANGWDCNPLILIGGHYHCSPPGRPSVAEIIAGTDVPSVEHQVFLPNGSFAGTELLIRADLYAGQPCPTDQWLPVPPFGPVQYYACHHFEFTG